MVYTNLKNTAIALRQQGLSFSEIKDKVPVSKATLSKWLAEIKLSPVQRSRLKQKRTEAAKRGAEKKVAQTLVQIEEIQKSSKREIGKVSKRELWLMGLVLYWKNRNKSDLKKGVQFTSGDSDQIKFFLRWLEEAGGLKKEEIDFDLFVAGKKEEGDPKEAKKYWVEITGFSEENLDHVYWLKKRLKRSKKKVLTTSPLGLLRIRVKASSMLARQISGWIQGLKEILI